MQTHEFEIFADYFMIFIQDDARKDPGTVSWREDDFESMLYLLEGGFIIGTARNMTVPLTVNIHETRPVLDDSEYDQIVEAGLDLSSGILSISGTTDYIEDHRKIELGRGIYNALVCYSGLGTLSEDGLDGEDAYALHLWPGDTLLPKRVIKQWEPQS